MKLNGANVLMGGLAGNFDGHAHIFRADLPMAEGRRYTPNYDALLCDCVKNLQRSSLDGAILVQPSFLGPDNSFLINALSDKTTHMGKHMRGVVVLDPLDTTLSKYMFAEMSDAGIIGLRLNVVGLPDQFVQDLDIWNTVLKYADAAGWHVEVHCEGRRLAPLLNGLLKRCSHIVVDHFGLPDPKCAMRCEGQSAIFCAPEGRVFIKTSAPYRVFPEYQPDKAAELCKPLFKRLLNELGPDQLLWGSDWPWTQFEAEYNFKQAAAWPQLWLDETVDCTK